MSAKKEVQQKENHAAKGQDNLSEQIENNYQGDDDLSDNSLQQSLNARRDAKSKKFTKEQDQCIIKIIEQAGEYNWVYIAQQLNYVKTPKQIRERYLNKLHKNIKSDKFSEGEDLYIVKRIEEIGSK